MNVINTPNYYPPKNHSIHSKIVLISTVAIESQGGGVNRSGHDIDK